YGKVDNFWAVHGECGPTLAFAGHTDVVPAGDEATWQQPPYKPSVTDGMLCGRGAADMKGSLAAMLVAAEQFVAKNPQHNGRLAFLITSDEEGDATDGTVKVMQYLQQQQQAIDWCVVGEPSSSKATGDTVKNGRRGSLGFDLQINGVQGHVAYPELARNPIHEAGPLLAELGQQHWDQGNEFFPPTTFQVSNITAGTGATNVVPGSLRLLANFRFSTELTVPALQQRVIEILDRQGLDYKIKWQVNGLPFLTPPGELVSAATEAIKTVTGLDTRLSTAGGTSDGRFIAPSGAQVLELGPVNATIHQVNERVVAAELDQLTQIYQRIMQHLLAS
ncbi:MAG: succinyl-diaminopimelate desuccinylase, partial [Pseudomonadales bacterium]|nr:succinyl-diaminopimelate desuccinylase [Pseudomonadales bacterium]